MKIQNPPLLGDPIDQRDSLWSRLIPRLIDQYVAREYLISFLISVGVVLMLRVIMDLFISFDEFTETRQGETLAMLQIITRIANYYGPKLFQFYRDFGGTIILLAATFSLVRMSRHNELTAILASGISLKRVIAPIVLLAFVLNLTVVADQELVLPGLADVLSRKQDEVWQRKKLIFWLIPDSNNALFSARNYDPDSRKIAGLHVILRKNGQVTGQITAETAGWNGQAWQLDNGQYFDFQSNQTSPIAEYQSTMSADYLWLRRNNSYKSLMSSGELGRLMHDLKGADLNDAAAEKHFRFTDPIINMVMLMLALPLLVSRERRNTRTAVFLAFLGSAGCFVATFACKLLAGDVIDPMLAAWLPIGIFLPLSILALDGMKT